VLHDDRVLLAEIASMNRDLVRFSCEVIDELAAEERSTSTRTQRELGERLIALGEALIERGQHPVLPASDEISTPAQDEEDEEDEPPGAYGARLPAGTADVLVVTGSM
jgi:hypothetical protein